MLATIRENNFTAVIPLKNKQFDSLFTALEKLKNIKEFSHINTLLSDKETAFNSGKKLTKIDMI